EHWDGAALRSGGHHRLVTDTVADVATTEGAEAGRSGLTGDHPQEGVAARRHRYGIPVIYEKPRPGQRISAGWHDRQAERVNDRQAERVGCRSGPWDHYQHAGNERDRRCTDCDPHPGSGDPAATGYRELGPQRRTS